MSPAEFLEVLKFQIDDVKAHGGKAERIVMHPSRGLELASLGLHDLTIMGLPVQFERDCQPDVFYILPKAEETP